MKWIITSKETPPPGTTILGYNEKWIDGDFNPEGIRECFMNDDNSWNSAYWDNDLDTWCNDMETMPTHWMQRPLYPSPLPADSGEQEDEMWANAASLLLSPHGLGEVKSQYTINKKQ